MMTNEMTSFVLRFVREVSEEQGARWRGLIQHVQGGTERNFATFAEAVQFMQERVVESTVRELDQEGAMTERNPLVDAMDEMTKMWGSLGPQMVEMWTRTREQMLDQMLDQTLDQTLGQSAAFRFQVDEAVSTTLKAWGLPTQADQNELLNVVARLGDKIDASMARVDALTARLDALERKLAAQDQDE